MRLISNLLLCLSYAIIYFSAAGNTVAQSGPYTPKVNSIERTDLCDILRQYFFTEELKSGKIVEFVIDHLVIDRGWAGFQGSAQFRGGAQIEDGYSAVFKQSIDGEWELIGAQRHGEVMTVDEFSHGHLLPISILPLSTLRAEVGLRESDTIHGTSIASLRKPPVKISAFPKIRYFEKSEFRDLVDQRARLIYNGFPVENLPRPHELYFDSESFGELEGFEYGAGAVERDLIFSETLRSILAKNLVNHLQEQSVDLSSSKRKREAISAAFDFWLDQRGGGSATGEYRKLSVPAIEWILGNMFSSRILSDWEIPDSDFKARLEGFYMFGNEPGKPIDNLTDLINGQSALTSSEKSFLKLELLRFFHGDSIAG